MSGSLRVSKVETLAELGDLPKGLSFLDPILRHEVKEALESGREAFISQNSRGDRNSRFIYDRYEATGTVFAKSRETFDHFYELKPSSYIFSGLEVEEHPKEVWN